MDKNYYYRILGLRSDASQTQIRKAYNDRIAKLSSPDYDDDPEYAQRKKQQATMAYKVLIGSAPVPDRQQKENRFEKLKDSLEAKEDMEGTNADSLQELLFNFIDRLRFNLPASKSKSRGKKAPKLNGQVIAWIVVIAVCIIVLIDVLFDGMRSEYTYDGSGNGISVEEQELRPELSHEAEYVRDIMMYVDYKNNLDMSTIPDNQDTIVWNQGEGMYAESDVYHATLELIYALDIYDVEEFYSYITSEEDYYYDNDDLACAEVLITWIGAPDFVQVAGGTSHFTQEPILNMEDYLLYLEELVYYEI